MSGPIVRRYGFPNFESIFGKRELQHGVDEPPAGPGPEDDKKEAPREQAPSKPGEASGQN